MIACSYGCGWASAELSLGLGLPAIVGERLVGLGHVLLPPLPRETDQPTHGQRRRSSRLDLDRHLVGGAADTTALDLQRWAYVVQCALQGLHRVDAGLGPRPLHGGVHDALGDGLLAVEQDLADQLAHQRRPVYRIDHHRALRGGALARHYFSFLAPYRLRACLRFFTP